ncbi:MAG TPA: tRNA (adenosine(37)-N6)-threonylcarbamoyltransferase complex dimerization subunit type 1 TsaB [Candidatus Polarisedimenticolia bacterium]|nr:tRNA (adenosine(37)-N6)-threonylcarbamoyltransferase complex dimerization subunit type 1 TsaB [Candidatus Polarisedimenticolia bacterium]
MPVLGIDTATPRGSIALARAGRVLAETHLEERAWHARDLLSRIDSLLKDSSLTPRDLVGLGVAVGPGSFTGVRIGMATAKGLAYSLAIGCVGLSTLEALARAVVCDSRPLTSERLCPVLDAGRGEVYAALFRFGVEGEPVRETPDRSWRPADLVRAIPAGTVMVGDAAASVAAAAGETGLTLTALAPTPPLAGAIALWAAGVLPPGGYRPGALGPNYVRPSDAEATRRR